MLHRPIAPSLPSWRITFLLSALLGASLARAESLPIFDTHVHWSEGAWEAYPPDDIRRRWDSAGVIGALVSSTPDDGTLRLHAADPARVVPELRPYHAAAGLSTWTRAPGMLGYLKERLARGRYAGIGEFHLYDRNLDADKAFLEELAVLAREHALALHVHSGAGPVRFLFALDAKLVILWAHAGFTEPPSVIGEMLAAYPNLCTEVSFRGGDIAPGGTLAAAWRDLFERFPNRFMIGSDTYAAERWADYGALIDEHRRWLRQLPDELAQRIAWRNAAAFLGIAAKGDAGSGPAASPPLPAPCGGPVGKAIS